MKTITMYLLTAAVCTGSVFAEDTLPADVRNVAGPVKPHASSKPVDSVAGESAPTLDDALAGFRRLADEKRPFAVKFDSDIANLLQRVGAMPGQKKTTASMAESVAVNETEDSGVSVARARIAVIAQTACQLSARLEALASSTEEDVFLSANEIDCIAGEIKEIVDALAAFSQSSDRVVALTAEEGE